jgi:hypothetical protein
LEILDEVVGREVAKESCGRIREKGVGQSQFVGGEGRGALTRGSSTGGVVDGRKIGQRLLRKGRWEERGEVEDEEESCAIDPNPWRGGRDDTIPSNAAISASWQWGGADLSS